MTIHDHALLVDEEFFPSMFQIPYEGIYSFADVSSLYIEEMQIKSSTSSNSIKISYAKRELIWVQLLADVASMGILAQAGSFSILTLEKF